MGFGFKKFLNGIRLRPNATTKVTELGDLDVTSDGKLRHHDGTSAKVIVTETTAQTLTNKSIDGDDNSVTDLSLSSLKTVLSDANKLLTRDSSGNVVSTNALPSLISVEIADNKFTIVDNVDNTKKAQLELSGVSTATTRTLSIPDASTTLLGTDAVQTITNKTLIQVDDLTLDGNTISSATDVVIDDKLIATKELVLSGSVTDNTTIGSNATLTLGNNYSVVLTNASLVSIEMISTNQVGRKIVLTNKTGNTIYLLNDTGATSSQRILTGLKTNLVLADEATLELVYSSVNKWIVIGSTATNAGAAGAGSLEVRLSTTSNSALTGVEIHDGITPTNGDYILVNSQTASPQNGVYVYNSTGAWLRAPELDSAVRFIPGFEVSVLEGNIFAGSQFFNKNSVSVLGTTPILFQEIKATDRQNIQKYTAGETLVSGDFVYMSVGNANGDSSRTLGNVYKVDITNSKRVSFLGIVVVGAASGNSVYVRIAGKIEGLTGLVQGQVVYASSTNGAMTQTKPNIDQTYIVQYGIADSTTSIVMNEARSATNVFNGYAGPTVHNMGAIGKYSTGPSYPLLNVGSQEYIYTKQRIKNIVFAHSLAGSTGTSQFDIKVFRSGSWQSIFSTLPSIDSTSAADTIFDLIMSAPTGVIKPVLASGFDVLNDGEKIRFDIISTMSGATAPDTINIKIYTVKED